MGSIAEGAVTIGVLGLGHVGLPTALCLTELGWPVIGADQNQGKVAALRSGACPMYEPGLQELLGRHLDNGRFRVVEDVESAIQESLVLFICVGTPQRDNGEADPSQIEALCRTIARNLNGYKLIVEKSTVPVKTAEWIKRTVQTYGNGTQGFDVASNPEFLREGTAVQDFLNPDRIVLGVESERARDLLLRIYQPLIGRLPPAPGPAGNGSPHPRVVVTDIPSAELIKHASNAFLATKISFINMIADLCERTGADVKEVARGIGLDSRIGPGSLHAGIGYGGYCLPKDIRALTHIGEQQGMNLTLLREVDRINEERIEGFLQKLRKALWVIRGKRLAMLGLAFKAGTDDIREAPSLRVIGELLAEGACLRLHDPQAMRNVREVYPPEPGRVEYCTSPYEAAQGAQALLVLTEWEEYRRLDLKRLREAMEVPVLLDGRNIYEPETARKMGFQYRSVGRP